MTSEYYKNWYLKNKQRHSEQAKARYLRNRESILANQHAARLADPEKYRSRQRIADRKRRIENREKYLQAHKRRYWRQPVAPSLPDRALPYANYAGNLPVQNRCASTMIQ